MFNAAAVAILVDVVVLDDVAVVVVIVDPSDHTLKSGYDWVSNSRDIFVMVIVVGDGSGSGSVLDVVDDVYVTVVVVFLVVVVD